VEISRTSETFLPANLIMPLQQISCFTDSVQNIFIFPSCV